MPESQPLAPQARALLEFWFRETDPKLWFAKDDDFDATLAARFGALSREAVSGGLTDWESTPEGCLALILLLDQITRNTNRGSAAAFAGDPRAQSLTLSMQAKGWDQVLEINPRKFVYMPLMHSEDPAMQEQSIAAFTALGDPDNLHFAHLHKQIIDRFGRYPHRDTALGRISSPEELAFLQEPDFSF